MFLFLKSFLYLFSLQFFHYSFLFIYLNQSHYSFFTTGVAILFLSYKCHYISSLLTNVFSSPVLSHAYFMHFFISQTLSFYNICNSHCIFSCTTQHETTKQLRFFYFFHFFHSSF